MKSTFYQEKDTKEKLCEFIKSSKQLSMGPMCNEFEKKFSIYQCRKYSVLFNSGSSANLALIQSLINLKKLSINDNIGFSALTWATNVMPLIQLGLNPIPIDISLRNLNVNLENLESLREKIKILFITNLLGFCGDLDKIKKFCEEKEIILIEDNCESLGSELGGVKLGNFGLASTFSFFVGHHLSTIEGGMVCTDDEELYHMLLMVRAHGWSRNLDKKESRELESKKNIDSFYNKYTFYIPGYNIRPTEITGFIGIEQLKYIQEINEKRKNNFLKFLRGVNEDKRYIKLELDHMSFVSNFAFPLLFSNKEDFIKLKNLFEKDVEIRPIVGGNMLSQPFFLKFLNNKNKKPIDFLCPNATKVHENGFYFPNNPEMTQDEINLILKLLKEGQR